MDGRIKVTKEMNGQDLIAQVKSRDGRTRLTGDERLRSYREGEVKRWMDEASLHMDGED